MNVIVDAVHRSQISLQHTGTFANKASAIIPGDNAGASLKVWRHDHRILAGMADHPR